METNFRVANNPSLEEAAQALLDAAMHYWDEYNKYIGKNAVVWLKDTSGRMVVLTRGEYQPIIMQNIDILRRDNNDLVPYSD